MVGKRIATLLVIVICGVVLLFSYMNWKDKLSNMGNGTLPAGLSEIASADAALSEADEVESTTSEEPSLTLEAIMQLTANMPESVAELVRSRFETGDSVRLLIAGSQAIAQGGEGGAAGLTAGFLDEMYAGFIETDIIALPGTSKDFLDTMEETVDWANGYDLLLLEPFTLNNNGKVIIEDEHRHITAVLEQLLAYIDDAELIVMPSQPIYRPNFYGTQIRALEKFAESRAIPYIDHWEEWPDTDSENIYDYLEEDSAPNDMGATAWASAMQQFFGAEF